MAKSAKSKPVSKKRGKYDEKLAVNGSFLDIVKAAAKHTHKNNAPKKDKS